MIAVSGPASALGDSLKSPIQGLPCISYCYDILSEEIPSRGGKHGIPYRAGSCMGGFAMCPSAIRTSNGEVKLLGFVSEERPEPDLTHRGIRTFDTPPRGRFV